MKRGIVIVLFLVALQSAWGQLLNDTIKIPEVNIVSQHKISIQNFNKNSIDSVVFAKSLTSTLSGLLAANTPVFIKTYGEGGIATASMRGTAASHTKVQWNGIDIETPSMGQVDFSLIPVYFTDDISLYYSGNGLIKGSGALGGYICLDTKPDWNNRFSASYIQGISSFSNYQEYLTVAAGKPTFQTKTRLFYESAENDFTIRKSGPDQSISRKQTNADFTKYGFAQEVYTRIGKSSQLKFTIWGQSANRNFPPLTTYEGIPRKENQQDKFIHTVAGFKSYVKRSVFELTSGFSVWDNTYMLSYTDSLAIWSLCNSSSFTDKFKYSLKLSENTSLFSGIDYQYQQTQINDKISGNGYVKSRNSVSIYSSIRQQLFPEVYGILLLKQDFSDSRALPFLPSLSFNFEHAVNNHSVKISTNVARNYHLPSLNDLYYYPGGNAGLKPENGYTADVSFSYNLHYNNLDIENKLNGFASSITDWIIWKPTEYRYWTAENVKKVFSRGIEYFMKVNGTVNQLNYTFITNYAFTRTTNENKAEKDDSYGKQLIYIPVNTLKTFANIELKNWQLGYSILYIGKRFTSTSNEAVGFDNSLPAYFLHDIEFGKKLNTAKFNVECRFRIQNVFDVQYEAIRQRAMPGRNYSLLLRFKFKN